MKLVEEIKNKAVITTKYVMNDNSPIVSVFYDEDGDWQFWGKEDFRIIDACVLSVQQILDIDETLALIPNLLEGQSAFRKDKNSLWEIRN